jgi:LmbE family N-acetylglucosaminyl deacetylase
MPPREVALAYEVWTPLQEFQYVVDTTDLIDQKADAMRYYESQIRHARWDQAIHGLASFRGVVTKGSGYAEVFALPQTRLSVHTLAGVAPDG